MKKIITSIFILMFYLGCSPSQKDVLFANASDEQIIEWGKQYVVHSIEDSLKEGESYKIMEWILAEKKTSIPVEVWQMDISICHTSTGILVFFSAKIHSIIL